MGMSICFVLQGKEVRNSQMALFLQHIKDVYLTRKRKWVVIFPEGGFLRKRRQRSQA